MLITFPAFRFCGILLPVLFFHLCFCGGKVQAVEENLRGLSIVVKNSNNETSKIDLYKDSYALVIGVTNYTQGWPSLPGVRSDIQAVTDKLKELNFSVTTVLDPDALQLRQSFENFIAEYGNEP